MNARVGANFDDRSRTGRDGRVSTVCGEGIGQLGRQIWTMGAECVHHSASDWLGCRGMVGVAVLLRRVEGWQCVLESG